MIHSLIAAALQVVVGLLTGDWLTGGAFAVGFYVGREHAQAEYRWIERYAGGARTLMPWWGGFDHRVWGRKSVLDFALPAIAVGLIAFLRGVLPL
jgi:hypothetical protein